MPKMRKKSDLPTKVRAVRSLPFTWRKIEVRDYPALQSLSDLCTFGRDSDPLDLLQSTAGDFAPDMARIFPNDWAWAALSVPHSSRQIWFAVLSGLESLPVDCTRLRTNLLTLDLDFMLRLRFGDVSGSMRSMVSRIDRYPLPRGQYEKLAQILDAHPGVINWCEGQGDVIGIEDLSDLVSHFMPEPRPPQDEQPFEPSCSIPDDHIDPRRSAFFMARSVLRDI
jgi:hypothetical protein